MYALIVLTSCNTNEPTAKYVTWHCVETSTSGTRTYLVDVYRAKNDTNTLYISNFHNISYEGNYDVSVKLEGNKLSFTQIPQQIGNSQFRLQSGEGSMDSGHNRFVLNYMMYNGSVAIPIHTEYTH